MPVPITVKRTGLRVSLLLWQAYGQAGDTPAMLQKTYATNPGLAALGPILPLGARLTLPDLETAQTVAARQGVSLFGTA